MKKKYKNVKLIVYKQKSAKENKRTYQKNYLRSNLVELYNAQVLSQNKTREIQWKYSLSIWLLILTLSFLKYLHSNVFSQSLVGVVFLITFFGHYIFAYIIQRTLAINRRIMDSYLDHLNHYSRSKEVIINNRKYGRMYVFLPADYLWIAFQLTITFLILLIFLQV